MTVKTAAFTVYVSALDGQQPTHGTSPLHVHEFGTDTLQHFYPVWCLLETSTRPPPSAPGLHCQACHHYL